MDFARRATGRPKSLGILAGTFNPPTRAHLGIATAALEELDEVVFVLPRVFPHKQYEGASFAERIRMLLAAIEREPRFSVASTEKGLFIDIARDARQDYGSETGLYFLCGRDAAERIANWDYGSPEAFEQQLREYKLLVAPRQGAYEPPERFRESIRPLRSPCEYDDVSATAVRDRIRQGLPWEHLVPPEIVPAVRDVYRRAPGLP